MTQDRVAVGRYRTGFRHPGQEMGKLLSHFRKLRFRSLPTTENGSSTTLRFTQSSKPA
jgi:hypothetical protein